MKKKNTKKSPKKVELSQKKRIPLLYEIFTGFRFLTAQHLYNKKHFDHSLKGKLEGRNIYDETDQLAIIRTCLKEDENLKKDLGNIGVSYFDQANTYYLKNNYKPKEVDYEFFLDLFCSLFDYKKDGLTRNKFLKHLIKKIEYEINCDRFKKLEQIRILKKFIDRKPENPVTMNIVKDTLFTRFRNTKWYLYFYGYLKVGHVPNPDYWKIVRLTLEFDKKLSGGDLGIIIDNNEDEDHRNYIGKTDFRNSTDKVLVMNLKTEEKERDLNIKFSVTNLKSSFFEGQYLNYEANSGRIISGSILMINYDGAIEEFHPDTFSIPYDLSKIQENDDKHMIIKHFQKSDLVFRETLSC
jgi:hypothetical protein